MDAAVLGDKMGVVKLSGPNPFVVQMQEFFMAKPRGHGKYDFGALQGFEPANPRVFCAFCGGFSGSLVHCNRYGADWIPAGRCVECPSNWFKKKGEG